MKIKLTKFTLAHAEEPLVKIGDEPLTLEFVTDYDISDAQRPCAPQITARTQ